VSHRLDDIEGKYGIRSNASLNTNETGTP